MAATDMFKQCRLRKPPDTFTYTWVPVRFASAGKAVALAGEDGWIVEEVYGIVRTGLEVMISEDAHRRQREVSDI